MPKIAWDSEKQRNLEWRVALSSLKDAPNGTKIKRRRGKSPINYTDPETKEKVNISHSFIKVNGQIYVMAGEGKYLGEGAYGKVKLAENENGELFALKIQKSKVYNSEEDQIAMKYGVGHGYIKRKDKEKHYSVQKYLGISLKKYLLNKTLSIEEQFNLSLKIIEAVEDFQQKTGKAHLDIKPDNICIAEDGSVSLIDYGFSSNLNENMPNLRGTPGFLPKSWKNHPAASADLIALKRVLYDPQLCWSNGKQGRRYSDDQWVIQDQLILNNPLLHYALDTESGDIQLQSISDFKKLMTFIKDNWAGLKGNADLQKAVVALDENTQDSEYINALKFIFPNRNIQVSELEISDLNQESMQKVIDNKNRLKQINDKSNELEAYINQPPKWNKTKIAAAVGLALGGIALGAIGGITIAATLGLSTPGIIGSIAAYSAAALSYLGITGTTTAIAVGGGAIALGGAGIVGSSAIVGDVASTKERKKEPMQALIKDTKRRLDNYIFKGKQDAFKSYRNQNKEHIEKLEKNRTTWPKVKSLLAVVATGGLALAFGAAQAAVTKGNSFLFWNNKTVSRKW
ncbi:hypothetical protein L3V83_14240 [Thiotrichales bacterium 19X7-9]|nr:hypothetical protein [Thiotrichales bacterium 19X7-9]